MIKRLETGPRMSQAVVHGNTVYLAGQVADDPSVDVAGQTRQILASIDKLLAAAGSDRTRSTRSRSR
jgi:enamine deaminase RidA (YjgF/YER057c/UK114 family)